MEMTNPDAFKIQMQALHRAYVEQLPGKVAQIESLWKSVCLGRFTKEELSSLYHLVHKLSGSGPTFGFTALTEKTQTLEGILKKCLQQGVGPNDFEEHQGNQIIATLKIIAAGAGLNHPGFANMVQSNQAWSKTGESTFEASNVKYTVLVADDEAFLRKKLVLSLREAGFKVEEAEDGLTAVTLAKVHKPDLIIMDYLMPMMDGIAAIQQIREDESLRSVPVLMLTTHSKIKDVKRMFDCPVDGYIAKPFEPQHVIARVQETLHKKAWSAEVSATANETRKRILIVDDYVVFRRKVGLILQEAGFQVEEADNGLMGVQEARKSKPDLILMDVMMPVMDGFDATRHIREEEALQDVPIIMLTTNVKIKDVPKALGYGVDSYIAKPMVMDQVVEKVRASLTPN